MKKKGKKRMVDKRQNHNREQEEFAAELAPDNSARRELTNTDRAEDNNEAAAGVSIGWVALVFAIASLFFWPVILGPTAAILGLFAYWQGKRTMGAWAIGIGAAAFLLSFFMYR